MNDTMKARYRDRVWEALDKIVELEAQLENWKLCAADLAENLREMEHEWRSGANAAIAEYDRLELSESQKLTTQKGGDSE